MQFWKQRVNHQGMLISQNVEYYLCTNEYVHIHIYIHILLLDLFECIYNWRHSQPQTYNFLPAWLLEHDSCRCWKIELSYGTGLQQVQKAGYTPDTCMFFKTFCNIPLRVTSEEYRKVP